MSDAIEFSVFTKPWKMPIPELGKFIHGLGVSAIELPVRDGYPVDPKNAATELPRAVKVLRDFGVHIASVAAVPSEPIVAACFEAHVPIVRYMAAIPKDQDYLTALADVQRGWDELVPFLDEHRVTLGVQNHSGRYVTHAFHLYHALQKYDRKHVAAVWDCSHQALQGEDVELALDVVWPKLCMVNFKNAMWQRRPGPADEPAKWDKVFVPGRQGLADWKQVAGELKRRGYKGTICLSAEYTEKGGADKYIAADVAYARSLFA